MTPEIFHILHAVGFAAGFSAAVINFISLCYVTNRGATATDQNLRSGWLRLVVIMTFLLLGTIAVTAASYAAAEICVAEGHR